MGGRFIYPITLISCLLLLLGIFFCSDPLRTGPELRDHIIWTADCELIPRFRTLRSGADPIPCSDRIACNLSTGLSVTIKEKNIGHIKEKDQENKGLKFPETLISTTQRDITTPITTVPTITPTNPTSSTPIVNPNSNPADSTVPVTSSPSMTPFPTTTTPSSPASTGSSWCVASQSASQMALQVALDYACGHGGTDCSEIQPGRSCYNPNSVRDHASYAFNNYYQKKPVPNSCNFGGTAMITSTDPSTGSCQYPSTSTSSSVLNTTNTSGSTVFGAVPSGPTTSAATVDANTHSLQNILYIMVCLMVFLRPVFKLR